MNKTNEAPHLKPCPFCGREATIRECSCGHSGNGEFIAMYELGCDECKIKFRRESRFRLKNGQPVFAVNGHDACIEAWNRRANDEQNV